MGEHPHPDDSIVHHAAARNGQQQEHGYAPIASSGNTATPAGSTAEPATESVTASLNPPRRFLLCHDDDLDEDLPLIETIPPGQLDRIDPADVRGYGIETDDYALLSLDPPGGTSSGSTRNETARCASAIAALSLFSRIHPLRRLSPRCRCSAASTRYA